MANADYTADGYVSVAPDFAPVSVSGNQLPGETAAAVADPYTTGPSFAGGYYGEQQTTTGGGYDPNNPSYGNQANSIGGDVAVSENYTGAPDYNAVSPGGYDPNAGDDYYSGGGYDPTTAGLDDPTNARLETSGLLPGGNNSSPAADPSVAFQSATGPIGAASPTYNDWRVRISLADGADIFYKDPTGTNGLMSPLIATNGVIFPYTPTISVTHSANYSPTTPTHSNYPIQFYNNSEVQDISITGDFSVQSVDEGQYLMAAVYFFRAASKMFFGSGKHAGNPPPIVFLDGYGSHYFPHVPCVISSFQHTLSNEVDYIEVPITSTNIQNVNVQNQNLNIGTNQLTALGQQFIPNPLVSIPAGLNPTLQVAQTGFQNIQTKTRVPTTSQITITLKPVYSRKNLHDRFDLNKFAAGGLLQSGSYGGYI